MTKSDNEKEQLQPEHVAQTDRMSPAIWDTSPVNSDNCLKESFNSSLSADDSIKMEAATLLKQETQPELSDTVNPVLCHSTLITDRDSDLSLTSSDYGTPINQSLTDTTSVQYASLKTSPFMNTSVPSVKNLPMLANSAGMRCPPVREAVDPAKYITISGEPDGVKYACSKCGNIYKWRKSLNKHWKEKHDGEAPDPAAVSAAASNRYGSRLPPPISAKRPASAMFGTSSTPGGRPLSSATRPTALRGSLAAILPPMPSQSGSGKVARSPADGRECNQSESIAMHSQLPTPTFADYKIPSKANASPFSLLAIDAASTKERPVDLSGSTSRFQTTEAPDFAGTGVALDLSTKGTNVATGQLTSVQDEPIDFSTKNSSRSTRNPGHDSEISQATFAGRPLGLAHASNVGNTLLNCAQCRQKFTVPSSLNRHFADMHAELLQITAATAATSHANEINCSGSTQLYRYLTTEAGASRESINCVVCGAMFLWRSAAAKHFDQDHVGLYPNPYQVVSSMVSKNNDRESALSTHNRIGSVDQQLPGSGNHLRCGRCPFTTDSFSVLARHHLRHSPRRPTELMTPEVSRIIWGGAGDPDDMKAAELQLLSAAGGTAVNMDDVIGENTAIVIPQAPEETATTIVASSSTSSKPFKQSASRSSGVRGKRSDASGSSSMASAETLLPFKCDLCEYRARWPSEMTQHAKNHSDEKPYHCPQCTYRSKWKWDVVKHLKRCGGGGTARDVIDTTNLSTSTSSPVTVTAAAAVCHTARRRRNNVRSLLIDAPLTTSLSSYDRGTTSVNDNSTKSLPVSSTLSTTVSVREHLSNGPPNVLVCSRLQETVSSDRTSTSTGEALQTVANTASNVTSASGQAKPAETSSPIVSLINHGLHYCIQCSFIGHSPAELRRHLRVHSDEKPYSCRTCCYSSKWKCDLKKHLRAYNHVSAVPLAYGGHGRKPTSDCQSLKDDLAAGRDDEFAGSKKYTDNGATDAQTAPDTGNMSSAVSLLKCDEKDSVLSNAQKMPNGSNFGGITAGGRLRCRKCDFEAIDLTSFLQHKSSHAVNSDDKDRRQQEMQVVVTTAATTRPAHHRRKSSKQVRVLPDGKMDKYVDKTLEVDNSGDTVHYVKQQNENQLKVSDSEDCSKFWTSLGLRSKNGIKYVQPAEITDLNSLSATVNTNQQECATLTEVASVSASRGSSLSAENIEKVEDKGPATTTPSPVASSCDTDIDYVDLDQPVDLCWRGRLVDVDDAIRQSEEEVPMETIFRQVGQQMSSTSERVTTTAADDVTGMSKRKRKLRTCDKCGYVTDNLTTLQRHAAKHGSTGRHRCQQCDYTVDRQHILDYHVKNVHGAGMPLTPNFSSVDELTTTMDTSDEELTVLDEEELQKSAINDASCSTGPTKPAKQRRSQYTEMENAMAMYCCISCCYSGHSVGAMTRHRLSHSSWSMPYRCLTCSRRTTTRALMLKHVKMHDQQLQTVRGHGSLTIVQYACSYCSYKSSSALHVAEHERYHGATGRYACPDCSYKVDNPNLLNEHRSIHVSGASSWSVVAPLRCTVTECPFWCRSRDQLVSHGRQHAPVIRRRRYTCSHCSYAVDRCNALRHHQRLHDRCQ